ncbi:hypothetical protein [Delftia sp. UME58]|uniref:hypothetical protein n=1 Tax=Delftia sp. UME58 TaxID=1862322 RepID=UPI0015FF9BB7|nr:hypothetical protein [Delftia sp. UME58]
MKNFDFNAYKLTTPQTKEDVLAMLDRSLMLARELKAVTERLTPQKVAEPA